MADEKKSIWEKLLAEISSPWDWAAAALGASVGAGGTIISHGADLGTSMAVGASAGIGVKKAAAASSKRWQLKRRAKGILKTMDSLEPWRASMLSSTRELLNYEISLLENGATTNEDFEKRLGEALQEFRERMNSRVPVPPGPIMR